MGTDSNDDFPNYHGVYCHAGFLVLKVAAGTL